MSDNSKTVIALIAAIIFAVDQSAADEPESVSQPNQESPDVLYLHTEWIPYTHEIENDYQYLMLRELARQSFLISAHHDFGMATRDETLGESAPQNANVLHLALLERADSNGKSHLKVYAVDDANPADQIPELWPTEPLWEQTFDYKTPVVSMYRTLAEAFDLASTDGFKTALELAGVVQNANHQASSKQPALDDWRQALLKVDFVTQYGVVREVHAAIDQCGESPEMLGLLARGYANLSMLTQHHPNAVAQAFAARAIVYLARVERKFEVDDQIRLDQMYVSAIIGQHARALSIEKELSSPLAEAETSRGWVKLLDPYLQCDRSALKKLAQEGGELAPWASRLFFELTKIYRYPQWIHEASGLISKQAPAAYGAYATMCTRVASLGIARPAASAAPTALRRIMPRSLETLTGVPPTIKGDELWHYSLGQGIDDVWPADLNGDGFDEVIIGYNGATGLHVLDQRGTLLWKYTDIGNVWHVTSGDVDGDDEPEVVTTSAIGQVHVFNASGKKERDIDLSIYGNLVRTSIGGTDDSRQILVAGAGDSGEALVSVSLSGDTKFELSLPSAGTEHVDEMMIATSRPWAAVAMRGGRVHVVDVESGGIIATVSGQGRQTDVAWLNRQDQAPLLMTATGRAINSFEVDAAK